MDQEKNTPMLEIRNLQVAFRTYGGKVHAVRDVDMVVNEGECVAVVGESGCGKSVTAKSIMGLNPKGSVEGGQIFFQGEDLLQYSEKQMQAIRGDKISMIFQDPMTSLNPTMTVGKQIAEVLVKHQNISKADAMKEAVEFLRLVGIANPEKRVKEYPDSLSGGMRQRVMIAIAMCCHPALLIADEPTTALDVTVQAQILELMQGLQTRFNTAIILITHDLGVVANMAERVLVFYAGRIVENGPTRSVFYQPRHPYTWGLLKSMPKLNADSKEDLLSIEGAPPDLFAPPKGCAFAARCEYAMNICREKQPPFIQTGENHCAACWLNMQAVPAECRPAWMTSEHVSLDDTK